MSHGVLSLSAWSGALRLNHLQILGLALVVRPRSLHFNMHTEPAVQMQRMGEWIMLSSYGWQEI